MVCTRKENYQHNRQLSQLSETLNEFVIGNRTTASANGCETLELQTNDLSKNFGRVTIGENSVCQDQIIEKNIGDKIRKVVDNAVWTVENRVFDTILTPVDNIVILRVETGMRSINGSSERGPCSMVGNPDQGDFTGNAEDTPLM